MVFLKWNLPGIYKFMATLLFVWFYRDPCMELVMPGKGEQNVDGLTVLGDDLVGRCITSLINYTNLIN